MTEIQTLFPLKGRVTDDILKNGDRMDPILCVGALTLRMAMGDWANDRNVAWGSHRGYIDKLIITTEEGVNFMHIDKEMEVTFIVAAENTDSIMLT